MTRSFRITLVLATAAMWLCALPALALPRYTLDAGSRCSNCHVNPQGGGLRSNSGFYMMNTTSMGMVTWDKLGLQSVHENQSNTIAGRVTIGGDIRIQEARLGRPVLDDTGVTTIPDRLWVPMQATPGVNVKITDTLSATGSINLAGLYYQQVMNSSIYPGQSNFDAWIRWAPERSPVATAPVAPEPAGDATPTVTEDEFDAVPAAEPAAVEPPVGLPSVRLGMIQPSFGIRHDDHTLLIHGNAANLRQPIFPAFYNDLGAEVTWEGLHWLSIDAGAYLPRNFSEARFGTKTSDNKTTASTQPLASARVTFWPRIDSVGVNFWGGASSLYTPNFDMEGAHVGVGKTYWGSLFGEFTRSRDTTLGENRWAWLVQADYPIKPWITLEARYEQSHTAKDSGTVKDAQAVVAGVQWMPLPMLELRPEYRYLATSDYTMAQYTLQVHLYY